MLFSFIPFPNGAFNSNLTFRWHLSQSRGNIWISMFEDCSLALIQSKGFSTLTIIFLVRNFLLCSPFSLLMGIIRYLIQLMNWLICPSTDLYSSLIYPSAWDLPFNFPDIKQPSTRLSISSFFCYCIVLPTMLCPVCSLLYFPYRLPKKKNNGNLSLECLYLG